MKTFRKSSIVFPKDSIKLGATWLVAGVLIAFRTSGSNSTGPSKGRIEFKKRLLQKITWDHT